MQREKERCEREQQVQLLYQSKMVEEARRKKEAEDMILMLENEEKDLIRRLKRTQDMQQQVISYMRQSLLLSQCHQLFFSTGVRYPAALPSELKNMPE